MTSGRYVGFPVQFSLRTMLIAVAALCSILGVMVTTGFYELPIVLAAFLIAYLLIRFGGALYYLAVIPWTVGVLAAIVTWRFTLHGFETAGGIAFVLTLLTSIFAGATFTANIFFSRLRGDIGLYGALLSAFVPIALILFAGSHYQRVNQAKKAQQSALNTAIRVQLVVDIDKLINTSGRVPQSESELVKLLGKPMPSIQEYSTEIEIRYQPGRAGGYELHHLTFFEGDYFVYDSNQPNKGWFPFYD